MDSEAALHNYALSYLTYSLLRFCFALSKEKNSFLYLSFYALYTLYYNTIVEDLEKQVNI